MEGEVQKEEPEEEDELDKFNIKLVKETTARGTPVPVKSEDKEQEEEEEDKTDVGIQKEDK